MKLFIKIFLPLILGFMPLAVFGSTNQVIQSQQSKISSDLEQDFLNRTAKFSKQSMDRPAHAWNAIVAVFDSCDDKTKNSEFAHLINNPASGRMSRFEDLFVQVFVTRLLKPEDANSLKQLLSARCPEYVGGEPVEYVLAEAKGPEAISFLLETYALAGTNYASEVLLRGIGCAFPALRQQYKSDKAFIAAYQHWFNDYQDKCILNSDYVQPLNILPEDVSRYGNSPLFIGSAQLQDLANLEKAIRTDLSRCPDCSWPHYHLAVVEAFTGRSTEALTDLKSAFENSAKDRANHTVDPELVADARTNPGFTAIRDLPDFQKILSLK